MKASARALASLAALFFAFALCGGTRAALAAPYYEGKVLTIVVGYGPGGGYDRVARLLAKHLPKHIPGKPSVIVENMPGAASMMAANHLYNKAAPDGLTIGIAATATHAVNPWLYSKMPYRAATDFAPITQMLRVPNVLVMNAETAQRLAIHSVADLIAYAKANPGRLNYGSGGNGSAGHLAGELFKAQAGIFAVHIPYNGGNPAQLALLSGQVDFNFDNLATAAPNIRSGKLKALAVTTLKRSPALPSVPPVADTLQGFAIDTWWGLVAPAATPKEVVDRLNQAFVAALKAPETQTRFASLMAEPVPTTPQEFGAFMKGELAKYERVVKASGAKVD